MATYVCKFDFEAGNAAELSFSKGDTLTLVEKKTENWWSCRDPSSGKKGMVPAPYLEEVASDVEEERLSSGSGSTRPSLGGRGSSSRILSLSLCSSASSSGVRSRCSVAMDPGGFKLSVIEGKAVIKDGAELVTFDRALRRVADDDGMAALARATMRVL